MQACGKTNLLTFYYLLAVTNHYHRYLHAWLNFVKYFSVILIVYKKINGNALRKVMKVCSHKLN